MKNLIKKLILDLLIFLGLVSPGLTVDSSGDIVQTEQEYVAQETKELSDDDATMTILFYCIGSDLESSNGLASMDIGEMLDADLGDQVNVVIQAGGTNQWHISGMKGQTVQRLEMKDQELWMVEDIGTVSMVRSKTLSDFIVWGTEHYPADRYAIILWDHGGGTLAGFGYDEMFPNDTLTVGEMREAFQDGGVSFDLIGFDACLMSTVEIAYALSPYGNYLIASEETGPGIGWEYTGWLNTLARHPAVDISELGKQVVDDYMESKQDSDFQAQTLSVVDLKKIPELYNVLCGYFEEARKNLKNSYTAMAYARSNAKVYGAGKSEQIDLQSYLYDVDRFIDLKKKDDVLDVLDQTVVYTKSNVTHSNGLAIYYPYAMPEVYGPMLRELDAAGITDKSYQNYFSDFVTLTNLGRRMNYGQTSFAENIVGEMFGLFSSYHDQNYQEEESYDDESWYNTELAEQAQDTLPQLGAHIDASQQNGYLVLSEDDWNLVSAIRLTVLLYDDEGILDLGEDARYHLEDDALSLDYDGCWLALNGQFVEYHAEETGQWEDGTVYDYGFVSALLNGETPILLIVYWDEDIPEGCVLGYYNVEDSEELLSEREIYDLETGDYLVFCYDYYAYDQENAEEFYSDPVYVGDEVTVSYEDLDGFSAFYSYQLTDVYQNEYWTEWNEYE